jgi:hypothetical protein
LTVKNGDLEVIGGCCEPMAFIALHVVLIGCWRRNLEVIRDKLLSVLRPVWMCADHRLALSRETRTCDGRSTSRRYFVTRHDYIHRLCYDSDRSFGYTILMVAGFPSTSSASELIKAAMPCRRRTRDNAT